MEWFFLSLHMLIVLLCSVFKTGCESNKKQITLFTIFMTYLYRFFWKYICQTISYSVIVCLYIYVIRIRSCTLEPWVGELLASVGNYGYWYSESTYNWNTNNTLKYLISLMYRNYKHSKHYKLSSCMEQCSLDY